MKSLLIWTAVLFCTVAAQVVPNTENNDISITTLLPQVEDETTTTLDPELVTETTEMTSVDTTTTTEEQLLEETRRKRDVDVIENADQPNHDTPKHDTSNADQPNVGLANQGVPNAAVPNKVVPTIGVASKVADVVVPAPEVPEEECDLLCTKFDLNPICATNGICLHEFDNQCIMDTFNCKHRDLSFKAVDEKKCQAGAQKIRRCSEQDLKISI